MPLIIVSGYPTSGKSTRAAQLYSYLSERLKSSTPAPHSSSTNAQADPQGQQQQQQQQQQSPNLSAKKAFRLHLISDHSLSIPRSVYDLASTPAHTRSANASEKDARASLYGAVKRVLSDRDIVILDSANYIKGWRYQLHCEAKAVRTPSAILQVGCSVERARSVNEARLRGREQKERQQQQQEQDRAGEQEAESQTQEPRHSNGNEDDQLDAPDQEEPYEPANWENLIFRYEEPNPMTRWDSPLFPLIWEDDDARARKVFDDLWEAIVGEGRKTVRANQATVQRSREVSSDYLYVLDRETQDVVKKILEAQGEGGDGEGGAVLVPREGGGERSSRVTGAQAGKQQEQQTLTVELPGKKIGLPQLQRLRRAFIGLNRGGIGLEAVGDLTVAQMREGFVGYLNDAFENDE